MSLSSGLNALVINAGANTDETVADVLLLVMDPKRADFWRDFFCNAKFTASNVGSMCKQQRAFLVFCVTAMNFFSFGLKFAHAAFIREIHDKFAQCVSIKCQKEYKRKAPPSAIR